MLMDQWLDSLYLIDPVHELEILPLMNLIQVAVHVFIFKIQTSFGNNSKPLDIINFYYLNAGQSRHGDLRLPWQPTQAWAGSRQVIRTWFGALGTQSLNNSKGFTLHSIHLLINGVLNFSQLLWSTSVYMYVAMPVLKDTLVIGRFLLYSVSPQRNKSAKKKITKY